MKKIIQTKVTIKRYKCVKSCKYVIGWRNNDYMPEFSQEMDDAISSTDFNKNEKIPLDLYNELLKINIVN